MALEEAADEATCKLWQEAQEAIMEGQEDIEEEVKLIYIASK